VGRSAYDTWQRFSESHSGIGLLGSWAAAEATVWPVIPEFLLVPMAAVARRRHRQLTAASVLGSALGGAAVFWFASRNPTRALALVQRLPFVYPSQIEATRARLSKRGAAAFLLQPWSGISLKVWAVAAGADHLNPRTAIPTFVFARTIRMAIAAWLTWLVAGRFAGLLRDLFLFFAAAYLAVFFYFWRKVVVLRR
jgi:membrane protein YqaA with SNARE-associated domain